MESLIFVIFVIPRSLPAPYFLSWPNLIIKTFLKCAQLPSPPAGANNLKTNNFQARLDKVRGVFKKIANFILIILMFEKGIGRWTTDETNQFHLDVKKMCLAQN